MTNIEQKALELVNEVARERGYKYESVFLDRAFAENEALCRAIEQHEAFRQEVSDAVEEWHTRWIGAGESHSYFMSLFSRFIIAKPDPLEKLLQSIAITLDANDLREALDEAGLEIREKPNG